MLVISFYCEVCSLTAAVQGLLQCCVLAFCSRMYLCLTAAGQVQHLLHSDVQL